MRKLFISIEKEFKLVVRDIEGIILIFLMPLILVIVVALLQHRTFQNVLESKIPIVIVDADNDSLGAAFRKGIASSGMFEVTDLVSPDTSQARLIKSQVAEGTYQIGVFIPPESSKAIKNRALLLVQQQLPNALVLDTVNMKQHAGIELIFDPITKSSFRNLAKSKMQEYAAQIETQLVFETYTKIIDALTNQTSEVIYPDKAVIQFNEVQISEYTDDKTPDAVQHNVPAYTLFGMFLICIPIAGNIIKERSDGCLARLKTMPVSYEVLMLGKTAVFVAIGLVQAALIIAVGYFVMPWLDLPQLHLFNNWGALFLISFASALAATGYGIAIGTLATTHTQASTFGSVSTVILAAIGGVWIPVMLMPEVMRAISEISPLSWGIKGYYDVFLRNASIVGVIPESAKLILFYVACNFISFKFNKH